MAKKKLFNVLFSEYRHRAKRKGNPWALSFELFQKIIVQSCHYCGRKPTRTSRVSCANHVKTVGIDRLDSSLGYEPKNVVPCCGDCNQMKSDRSLNAFMETIKRICDEAAKKN